MARQQIANPTVTFSPEQLQAVIAEAIREHEERKVQTAKADASTDMDKLCIKAFKRAGFEDVQPRTKIKTYNLWLQEGRKVREGEKSVRVKSLRLFHVTQTDAMAASEKKEALAGLEAKKVKANGLAAPVLAQPAPAPSPVKPTQNATRKGPKILITSGGNA